MKNIIEDLGGVFDSDDGNEKPKKQQNPNEKIEIYPPTYNKVPIGGDNVWTVYLQFDDDTPIPFAFVPNGQDMRIKFNEPELSNPGDKAPALIFTDTRTNKRLRLFAKKIS